MSQAPLSWIKEIHQTLIDAKMIPLWGGVPEFPWKELSEKVGDLLHTELTIAPRSIQVLKGADILSGFGAGVISTSLELTPLLGEAFWVMGKEEVAALSAIALKGPSDAKGFSFPKFQEGFYHYLETQIATAINEIKAFGSLSLKIAKLAAPPQEDALCIDVAIELAKQTFWGRLIFPVSFYEHFKSHFHTQSPPSLTSSFAQNVPVTVRFELAHTQLSIREWKNVHIGDCILLDRCSFDPVTKKGTASLVLEQTPLMRVRIKESHLKIIDYSLYSEEKNSMENTLPPNENSEPEDFSSMGFEEENTDHLWATQEETEKLIPTKDIPLTLCVEVGRMQMTLEKLLQLSPGNILELPIRPEQGVDVVIGGKKVAKAELIKLGELLGIKILKLGD